MDFIRLFLILIVPGIISTCIYSFIARLGHEPRMNTSLIFSALIFIINITGLYLFTSIRTMSLLLLAIDGLRFSIKYFILSNAVGSVLAIILGLMRKIYCICKRRC